MTACRIGLSLRDACGIRRIGWDLDQLDEDAVVGPRVDEGHPGVAGAPPRHLVDEVELVLPSRGQRRLDALDLVSYVVKPLAPAGSDTWQP